MSAPSSVNSNGTPSASKTKELFNSALQSRSPTNNYIAHLKIWEEVPPETPDQTSQKKARYLILAVQKDNGKVTINKAKRNANGTFSIGKDWDLNTLREVRVHQSDVFSITLSRTYQWQTQQPKEQVMFLQTLVKVYRKYTQEDGPRLVGIQIPATGSSLSSGSNDLASPDSSMTKQYESYNSAQHQLSPPSATATSPPQHRQQQTSVVINYATSSNQTVAESISPSVSPVKSSSIKDGLSIHRDPATSHSSAIRTPVKSGHDGLNPSPLSQKLRLPSETRPQDNSNATNAASSSSSSSRRNAIVENLIVPGPTLHPNSSSESLASNSLDTRSRTNDARARLSSVEPVRGGAAYERMLLAGTGLKGVNEIDENQDEQDPYGGAVLADRENPVDSAATSKRATLGRPKMARVDSSERLKKDKGSKMEEDEDATLLAVEEMLEGFEWRSVNGRMFGAVAKVGSGKGTADVIEARLLDELSALESANIHAIIESDDRVALVIQHMNEALSHLDMMDSMTAGFKSQLNSRADDISYIESQNRGLQVQTSNQRTLMAEIENLINTINVDQGAIHTLSAGRLESAEGISQLERAAASLYKSMLQARRDGQGGGADMAAAAERLADHENTSARFCKRVLDYLNVTFNVEMQRLLADPHRSKSLQPPHTVLQDHSSVEEVLGRYCGLLLYTKEVSPQHFSRVSAAYFASTSECYKAEMAKLFTIYRNQIHKASDEDVQETSFAVTVSSTAASAIRSGTIRRPARDKSIKGPRGRGQLSGYEAFQRILSSVFPVFLREQAFIADFLHINDNHITFADYMDLEPYFKRRAAGMFTTSSAGPLREMKGALDLIFGFLAPELQAFTDAALLKERISIFGLLATLDRWIIEAEEVNCEPLLKTLSKLHLRLASQLERFIQEQIKGIEQTKLTVKKRKGIVHFMRVFPVFVERVESQLVNAETLNIRAAVDGYYDQISRAMFDALQTISRVDGGGVDEDKGQLNQQIILIENMWHFCSNISKQRNVALNSLVTRAEGIYGDSLNSYTHFVLRRPLAKMMDFGDGIDALLRSTPATEVSLHSAYSKSAVKKLVKDFSAKDVRKAIEALSKRVQKHLGDEDEGSGVPGVGIGGGGGGVGGGGNGMTGSGIQGGGDGDEAAEVLARVWASCEEGFVREMDRLARILRNCYGDNSISLEVTPQDTRRLFQTNAPHIKRR